MINVDLFGRARSILCLGAHADDIEIGCGGTLLALRKAHPETRIDIVLLTGDEARAAEAAAAAERLFGTDTRLQMLGLRDGYLPYDGPRVKEALREAVTGLNPDVIFTHRLDDLHQDHRHIADLTGQLFRDHVVLGYEIPKYDGDLGRCNFYVPFGEEIASAKIGAILDIYASQREKYWLRSEVLEATLRLRGVEARTALGFAEGFVATKLVAHIQPA